MRDLKPDLSRDPGGREIRASHSRGEGPQGSIGAGVGIRADDHIARPHNALLREKGMLHAHASDFIIMGDLVFLGEFAQDSRVFGGEDVLVGGEMVRDEDDPFLVKNLPGPALFKFLDGDGGGDVIAESNVDAGADEVAGSHLFEAAIGHQIV